jgi:hypothetical protein
MLDAFIIEEIKRRDREQSAEDRPVLELPLPRSPPEPAQHDDEDGPRERDRGGVVIIDYSA